MDSPASSSDRRTPTFLTSSMTDYDLENMSEIEVSLGYIYIYLVLAILNLHIRILLSLVYPLSASQICK